MARTLAAACQRCVCSIHHLFGKDGRTMATRIVTELHDDLDGSDATQTVRFALDGIEYEIDLSDRNANRFRNTFEEFVGHARKVGEGGGRKAATSVRANKSQTGTMREWLIEHGYEVSDRGRIQPGCNRFI